MSIILPFNATQYTEESIQTKIIALDQVAKQNSRYETQTINWMVAYKGWSIANNVNIAGSKFYQNLPQFLVEVPMFAADIVQKPNSNPFEIESARVIFFYENDNDAINQAEAMKTLRTDLKNSGVPDAFGVSIMFIYAEQFAAVADDTIRNLAICGGTIVVITIPYLMHPGITGLVFLSFSSLLFELLGLMTAWDVSLDVIAMIIIIMALGFSVDYTCHIAHAYMISQKSTPNKRAIDALTTMGTSVMNGGN